MDAIALYNAGTAALEDGELRPAQDLLKQAIHASQAPTIQGPAWRNLGIALRKAGATNQAADAFLHALQIDQDDSLARYSLANTWVAMGEYPRAIEAFRAVRLARPDWAQPVNNEGAAWMAMGRTTEAEACFKEAVRIDPQFAHAWGNLGAARAAQGHHATPLHGLQKALQLAPENQQIRTKLGHLLTELGHLHAAQRTFQQVLDQNPHHPDARAGLSFAQHRSGDSVRALATIAPAIAAGHPHPHEVVTFARIVLHLGRPELAIDVLEEALIATDHPNTKVLLGKQLGQILDAAGRFDEAFLAIHSANEMRTARFDHQQHRAIVDATIRHFNGSRPQSNCSDSTPVFIVGMPRSGTTLIEQMLDAHPDIHGAGERGELQMIAQHMREHTGTEATLGAMAETYLARIRPLAPNATFITDKMPNNFLYLGEAAQLFPKARVIHCVRDPADTGLSCLFQNFKETLDWAHRQEDIAHFTRDYRRLMDHWATNGKMRMLTVPYEALVTQPEVWMRRILRFLNLPFHSAVMHPEQNKRIVRTASHDQIRRPIHTESIGKSAKYKEHIEELIKLRDGLSQSAVRCDRKDDGRKHNV